MTEQSNLPKKTYLKTMYRYLLDLRFWLKTHTSTELSYYSTP